MLLSQMPARWAPTRRCHLMMLVDWMNVCSLSFCFQICLFKSSTYPPDIHSLRVTLLPLLYPEVFQNFGIIPPRDVPFHGPPGTGKRLLARALASSCRSYGKGICKHPPHTLSHSSPTHSHLRPPQPSTRTKAPTVSPTGSAKSNTNSGSFSKTLALA